jgi:hypothetical protein
MGFVMELNKKSIDGTPVAENDDRNTADRGRFYKRLDA